MKLLRTLRNYYFYCGIEKDEFNALKKDAYISNFKVWKVLHFLTAAVFGCLFVTSLFYRVLAVNRYIYLSAFLYSLGAFGLFFVFKKDSILAQFLIYLSMSLLFLFACFLTQNATQTPATSFIVFLLIVPMFMIDKPYFMTIELFCASAVFLIWMYRVKPFEVWQYDMINVVTYTIVGNFLNIIANSIRIKEFVLTRTINIQKDTDELTGLKNKGALTREINAFMADESSNKGLLFILDVDRFKAINDTFGHDVGDDVICQLGRFLGEEFSENDIVGRFGGDEFIVFIRNTDDLDTARRKAQETVDGVSRSVFLPDKEQTVGVSVGISVYNGVEKNYSDLFKKADIALYRAKSDKTSHYSIYE